VPYSLWFQSHYLWLVDDGLAPCLTRNLAPWRSQLLVSHGANPSLVSRDGWAPLALAGINGNWIAVALLVHAGADLNVIDGEGFTLLHRATASGDVDAITFLRNLGGDVAMKTQAGLSCIALAEKIGATEQVKKALLAPLSTLASDGWQSQAGPVLAKAAVSPASNGLNNSAAASETFSTSLYGNLGSAEPHGGGGDEEDLFSYLQHQQSEDFPDLLTEADEAADFMPGLLSDASGIQELLSPPAWATEGPSSLALPRGSEIDMGNPAGLTLSGGQLHGLSGSASGGDGWLSGLGLGLTSYPGGQTTSSEASMLGFTTSSGASIWGNAAPSSAPLSRTTSDILSPTASLTFLQSMSALEADGPRQLTDLLKRAADKELPTDPFSGDTLLHIAAQVRF
jgi:hypothetical protein